MFFSLSYLASGLEDAVQLLSVQKNPQQAPVAPESMVASGASGALGSFKQRGSQQPYPEGPSF